MEDLSGHRALVTGAARRTGKAIALALAREGVACILHYRSSEADILEVAEACRRESVDVDVVQADLADPAGVTRLAERALDWRVDVLVHNASEFQRTPFFDAAPEDHRALLEKNLAVHVAAPYDLARRVGESMIARGWGRIILLGDVVSTSSVDPSYAPYLVSKGAVPTLASVLAVELGRKAPGVTANAILPGPLLPPVGDASLGDERVREQTVRGDWLGVEGVAEAVVFLAKSDGITGSCLRVDGGRAVRAPE